MAEVGRDPFAMLVCPVCERPLAAGTAALRCDAGHAFDLARQGYVNLLPGGARPGTADSEPMVRARADFLAAGHYAALADAIAGAAPAGVRDVLDAGAGTGYYLRAVLEARPEAAGLGLDLSKFALRRAARAHPRGRAAVWDLWRPLPVRTGAADLVLNVFAPRNPAEFHRVLRPDGTLLVVVPAADHLAELRAAATGMLEVDADKADRLARALTGSGLFRPTGTSALSYRMALTPEQAAAAVAMGPAAKHAGRRGPVTAHAPATAAARASAAPHAAAPDASDGPAPFTPDRPVTASFLLHSYRPATR